MKLKLAVMTMCLALTACPAAQPGVDGGTGGGSATGGGNGGTACDVLTQQGCTAGESCLYVDNMGNGRCFAGACDVVSQNCPTATDKCSYAGLQDGGVARACAPAGPQGDGAACGPSDNCGKGLVCINSVCRKYCYDNATCGGGNKLCIGLIQIGGTQEIPSTCVTLSACDPLTQNCPQGQGCYLSNSSGAVCATAGTVAANGACGQGAGQCVPGTVCLLTSPTAGACKSFCNRDGGMPNCGTGQCGGLINAADGGVLDVGACQ